MRFNGDRSVRKLAAPYLSAAARDGIEHALFAIDNDGGLKRHPEHSSDHDQASQAADRDGCRVCWLEAALPASWLAGGRKRCVVVPVQTMETWLLCLRGALPFAAPSPEQDYSRPVLKKRFFGAPLPPVTARVALALAEVLKADALTTLRRRQSFRHFEAQLAGW